MAFALGPRSDCGFGSLLTTGMAPILIQIPAIGPAIERVSHLIFEEFAEATLQDLAPSDQRNAAMAEIGAGIGS